MKSLSALGTVARTFGARNGLRRAQFEIRRRVGALRTEPAPLPRESAGTPLEPGWPFVARAQAVRAATDMALAVERAERVLQGEHQAYRWLWRPRPLAPAAWHVDPHSGRQYDPTVPWFRIAHFGPHGDIKDVWEAGRFAWAYDLARGWMVTGDDRFAAAFWEAVESFRESATPFRGVHWACGQETAIRAQALLWSEGVFVSAPSSTPARLERLRQLLLWSGQRIDDAVEYALSQRNNHGISECAGLVMLGARFAGSTRTARRWYARGRALLEELIRDQFAVDGWYAQHSFNYLRLALDQVVLATRTLRWRGDDLSTAALARVRATVRLLASAIDPASGDVPNHGANDGAFVLPLTTAGFRDFRPSLSAAAATLNVPLPADVRADAETLAWLGADPPATTPSVGAPHVISGPSGWAFARTAGVRAFARAGRYRHRPSHIDSAHVDLWIDGQAVAVDPGSYRYRPPWGPALADASAHNTVTVEGYPAAERGPHFLWLRWPDATLHADRGRDGVIRIAMVQRLSAAPRVVHERTCLVSAAGATVLDVVHLPPGYRGRVELHWLLEGGEGDVEIVSSSPSRLAVRHGDEQALEGWLSESYAVKRPVSSLRMTTDGVPGLIRFATGFGAARDRRALERLVRGEHGTTVPFISERDTWPVAPR